MRAARSKSKNCLKLLIPLFATLAFFSSSVRAEETTKDGGEIRYLQVWGRKVEYHFLLQWNSMIHDDGEAFRTTWKGRPANFVVLNRAFFETDARELFRDLYRSKGTEKNLLSNAEFLAGLEKRLFSVQGTSPVSRQTLSALRALQFSLEQAAWREDYEESWKGASGYKAAEAKFAARFLQVRMKTNEYHEVAHLIDLTESSDNDSDPFNRYTELNAFYTELAYGENPQDVMVQALSGLLEEIEQGKTLDYSIEKVATVLRFLKDHSAFVKRLQPPEAFPTPFQMLVSLSRPDWSFTGRELYKKNAVEPASQLALFYP